MVKLEDNWKEMKSHLKMCECQGIRYNISNQLASDYDLFLRINLIKPFYNYF